MKQIFVRQKIGVGARLQKRSYVIHYNLPVNILEPLRTSARQLASLRI